MNTQTYYEVLGLASTCTAQEIKGSYHQLALIWHPDKHTDKEGANLQFMFINEAYNVLSDMDKRKIYDISGKEGLLKDQESKTNIQKNIFSQKSTFDILKELIKEKVNDDFLKSCEASGYSRSMHSSLKSFVQETVISSDEDTANFLADYQPTFLNNKFAEQSQFLDQFLMNKNTSKNLFTIKKQTPSTRARKNSFLAVPELAENKKIPFKVLRVVKTKSDALLLQTLKNSKRVFLINDEDEEKTEADDEFLMSFVQPKCFKRKSYCSEAVEDSDDICHNLIEKISKKLKTEIVV